MPGIECLIVDRERLLMRRDGAGLSPLEGEVRRGESPLEACARLVREALGAAIHPSAIGLVLKVMPGHVSDYDISFYAPAPPELAETLPDGLEWLALADLKQAADVSEGDRELLPRLLVTDHPLTVVVEVDPAQAGRNRRVLSVATMDAARLSPLVFAVLP